MRAGVFTASLWLNSHTYIFKSRAFFSQLLSVLNVHSMKHWASVINSLMSKRTLYTHLIFLLTPWSAHHTESPFHCHSSFFVPLYHRAHFIWCSNIPWTNSLFCLITWKTGIFQMSQKKFLGHWPRLPKFNRDVHSLCLWLILWRVLWCCPGRHYVKYKMHLFPLAPVRAWPNSHLSQWYLKQSQTPYGFKDLL